MANKTQTIKQREMSPTKTVLLSVLALPISLFNLVPRIINTKVSQDIYNKEKQYISEQDFERAVEEEKRALGLEKLAISVNTREDIVSANFNSENNSINFNPYFKKPCVLRHELYHAKRFYEGKDSSWLCRCFIPLIDPYEEFLATAYAYRRAKLGGKIK